MKNFVTLLICSVLSITFISATLWPAEAEAVAKKTVAPLKGLLITGGCCHDYDSQKKMITQGLSQRLNIEWDIVHEGGSTKNHKVSIYEDENWSKGFDVVVHNECYADTVDPDHIKKIVAGHKNVPAVFIHCAFHTYRDSPVVDDWTKLIGVASKKHEKKSPIEVKPLKPKHPVMVGFPETWSVELDELYIVRKTWPNSVALAHGFCTVKEKGQDVVKNHPNVWINDVDGVRFFSTSLGHFNKTINNDVFLGLISRGLLWTVKKIDKEGKPKKGYEGTGIKPMQFPDA